VTTTLTATPQLSTASVRLNIATTAGPTVILDLSGAAMDAESAANWSGTYSSVHQKYPDQVEFVVAIQGQTAYARRSITGLVVGATY